MSNHPTCHASVIFDALKAADLLDMCVVEALSRITMFRAGHDHDSDTDALKADFNLVWTAANKLNLGMPEFRGLVGALKGLRESIGWSGPHCVDALHPDTSKAEEPTRFFTTTIKVSHTDLDDLTLSLNALIGDILTLESRPAPGHTFCSGGMSMETVEEKSPEDAN